MKKFLTAVMAFLAIAPAFSQKLYEDDKVMIDKIEDSTYKIEYLDGPNNSTIYVIEGKKKALVVDAGDKKDYDLKGYIAKCTAKPYELVITHTHGDHLGAIDQFPSLWVNEKENMRPLENYKGKVKYVTDGQVFDLGGRQIQAFEIIGHTAGGMIFTDEKTGNCFVGDCFGTGQVWLQISPLENPISEYLKEVQKMLRIMATHHITHLYTGHFGQESCMYGLNYIQDMETLAKKMLKGDYTSEHHNRSPKTSSTQQTRLRRAQIVFNPDKVR